MGSFIFGLLLVLIGISALFGIELFKFVFAVALIVIGVRILMRRSHHQFSGEGVVEASDYLDEVAIFSPLHRNVSSSAFRGGKILLIFSGAEIDLRNATLAPGSSLEITAIFSGARVFVPRDWNVESRGAAVLGGFANHAEHGGGFSLIVTGSAIFGGVEILN
jgi:predicted membrane protein